MSQLVLLLMRFRLLIYKLYMTSTCIFLEKVGGLIFTNNNSNGVVGDFISSVKLYINWIRMKCESEHVIKEKVIQIGSVERFIRMVLREIAKGQVINKYMH